MPLDEESDIFDNEKNDEDEIFDEQFNLDDANAEIDSVDDDDDDEEEDGSNNGEENPLKKKTTNNGGDKPLHVLPLYALLSSEKQIKVFDKVPDNRPMCVTLS
jgi:ATP-dependent RNA helicase DHX37/DHR1